MLVAQGSRALGCWDSSGDEQGTSPAEKAWEELSWEPDFALLSRAALVHDRSKLNLSLLRPGR